MQLQIDENRIPPLPVVAARIMQFDPAGANASSSSMERIISPDQSISAEVLRVANSAYYGRSGTVKTVKDAITLLGLKAVKNLVILITTRTMASKIKGDLLRKHCIEFPIITALVCIDMAKLAGQPELNEEAFLCGLLHRIGMTIIALEKKSEYADLILRGINEMKSQTELEQSAYGTTSQNVCELVVKKWNLPESIAGAILGQGITPDQVPGASHQVRITSLSIHATRQLLQIPVLPEDDARTSAILAHYNMKADVLSHYTQEYFDMLKENPFYQNGVAQG